MLGLRLRLPRCQLRSLRRRVGRASADKIIGVEVVKLRSRCTGRWPVHFCGKTGGVAAALMLAAAPLSLVGPTAALAQTASQSQLPIGQGVGDFYKARKGAPLWFAPAAGDAADKLVALLSTASFD